MATPFSYSRCILILVLTGPPSSLYDSCHSKKYSMGLCLSRCGDAREQASVTVAPTDSHQDSQLVEKSMITASPYDPNHSLKRFLHLHAGPEPKKLSVSSTPRTSLAELFAAIPHSSELFSLPCSELDRSSFTLSPPADWTIKASSSSHFAFSPKSGFQSGRRIKRIRPARGGEPRDLVAHQRLVDAIARLERLNSGKKSKNFAVLRVGSSFSGPFSGSFCSSDLEPSATMAPKSCSGELLQRPASSVKSRRDVRHYQLPLHLMPKSGTMVEHQMIPLIDVPRLSSEAMPQREPLIISTTSNRRLRSNGFEDMSDSDEMFTFFEASFDEESELVRKHQSRSVRKTSLQRLVQSATQGGCQKAPVVEEFAVMESTKSRRESCKVLVPSSLHPIELLVEQSGTAVSAEAHDVSADPGVEVRGTCLLSRHL